MSYFKENKIENKIITNTISENLNFIFLEYLNEHFSSYDLENPDTKKEYESAKSILKILENKVNDI